MYANSDHPSIRVFFIPFWLPEAGMVAVPGERSQVFCSLVQLKEEQQNHTREMLRMLAGEVMYHFAAFSLF